MVYSGLCLYEGMDVRRGDVGEARFLEEFLEGRVV
jgi:hypothetical protein